MMKNINGAVNAIKTAYQYEIALSRSRKQTQTTAVTIQIPTHEQNTYVAPKKNALRGFTNSAQALPSFPKLVSLPRFSGRELERGKDG
jgi:hypothetical protein